MAILPLTVPASPNEVQAKINEIIQAGGGAAVAVATLAASGWSSAKKQTVSVTGVTAANTVVVTPAPASLSAYGSAGVCCSAQSEGKLTFTADVMPTVSLTVNILIYD